MFHEKLLYRSIIKRFTRKITLKQHQKQAKIALKSIPGRAKINHEYSRNQTRKPKSQLKNLVRLKVKLSVTEIKIHIAVIFIEFTCRAIAVSFVARDDNMIG